ncbi:preprotein translocase subunit SecE [Methylosoma difficile]
MNSQPEQSVSVIDIVKQVMSVVFVVAGVAAFYYFSDIQLVYRVLCLVAMLLVVVGVLYTTVLGKSVWGFVLESRMEVRKVVWPTRDETMRTTLMVLAMVSIVGVVLWVLDIALYTGVRYLTGQGG